MEQKDSKLQNFILKKDFFIKSRQEDIREYYEFNPKVLGRGAYGMVYIAKMKQSPHTQRIVKVITKKMVKNPESLKNQIEIMRKLDHPMIVRLYQTFQDEKNLYLIQDFCEGGQLFSRLQQHGNFSENEARQLFTQIIKCIKYMHSMKISHRDLKPQNFLMENKKTLQMKIIDFGLSYEWKEDMKAQIIAQKKNRLVGTSYYIAPEILKFQYDQKCDIWSAGVMLYILVTAAPPFDGADDKQIMQSVRKLKYTFDIPEAKHLSNQVKDLIKKILVPAQQRLSLDQIMNHPWMTKKLQEKPLQLNFTKLKNFANFSKFKRLAMTYIVTQLPQKDIHHLGKLFAQIDTNSDGYLTVQQIQKALQKQHDSTTQKQLTKIIQFIDTDKNGKINYSQFLACCVQMSTTQTEQYLRYIFKGLDSDHSGKISAKQLKEVFAAANIAPSTLNTIQKIIQECDKNQDGELDFKQFCDAMGLKK